MDVRTLYNEIIAPWNYNRFFWLGSITSAHRRD